jgi:hypothetical protein
MPFIRKVTILILGWDAIYSGVHVWKKNGDLHFCVDFRKQNYITKSKRAHYP